MASDSSDSERGSEVDPYEGTHTDTDEDYLPSNERGNLTIQPVMNPSSDEDDPADVVGNEQPTASNTPQIGKKKRVRKELWKRTIQKTKRVKGEPYINVAGVHKPGHQIGDNCHCKSRCLDGIGHGGCTDIFQNFYGMPSKDLQDAYLYGLIKMNPVQRPRPRSGDGPTRNSSFVYKERTLAESTSTSDGSQSNIPHENADPSTSSSNMTEPESSDGLDNSSDPTEQDEDLGPLRCWDCNVNFTSRHYLYNHLLHHIKQPSVGLKRVQLPPLKICIKTRKGSTNYEIVHSPTSSVGSGGGSVKNSPSRNFSEEESSSTKFNLAENGADDPLQDDHQFKEEEEEEEEEPVGSDDQEQEEKASVAEELVDQETDDMITEAIDAAAEEEEPSVSFSPNLADVAAAIDEPSVGSPNSDTSDTIPLAQVAASVSSSAASATDPNKKNANSASAASAGITADGGGSSNNADNSETTSDYGSTMGTDATTTSSGDVTSPPPEQPPAAPATPSFSEYPKIRIKTTGLLKDPTPPAQSSGSSVTITEITDDNPDGDPNMSSNQHLIKDSMWGASTQMEDPLKLPGSDDSNLLSLFNNNERAKDLGFTTSDSEFISLERLDERNRSALQLYTGSSSSNQNTLASLTGLPMEALAQQVSRLQPGGGNGMHQQNVLINIQQFPQAPPVQAYQPPHPPPMYHHPQPMYHQPYQYQPPNPMYYPPGPPGYPPPQHMPPPPGPPQLTQAPHGMGGQPPPGVGPMGVQPPQMIQAPPPQQQQQSQAQQQQHQQQQQQTPQQNSQQQHQQQQQGQPMYGSRQPGGNMAGPRQTGPRQMTPGGQRMPMGPSPRQPMSGGPRQPMTGGPRPTRPPMVRPGGPAGRGGGAAPMNSMRGGSGNMMRPRMPMNGQQPMRNGGQSQQQHNQQQQGQSPAKRNNGNDQSMQAKKRRFDVLTPDKDDEDCQVICMQPNNKDGGLPQIQSVQGGTPEPAESSIMHLSDSITLSVRNPPPKPQEPKKSDAKAVANILATRGITVTATPKAKQEPASPQKQLQTPLNLNGAVSIIPSAKQGAGNSKPSNNSNQESHLPTVDLTDDTAPTSPNGGGAKSPQKRMPFKCDMCPAQYPNPVSLSKHRQSYHKTSGGMCEIGIPLINLKQQGIFAKMASLGIFNYIPLPTSSPEGTFALPIINCRSGNAAGLGATTMLTLGPIRNIPRPPPQQGGGQQNAPGGPGGANNNKPVQK